MATATEPLLVRDHREAAVAVFALEHGADACQVRNFAVDARRRNGDPVFRYEIDRSGVT